VHPLTPKASWPTATASTYWASVPPASEPAVGGSRGPWSAAATALRMSRREMLRERQVAASLVARRAAHRARRPAHRRFQPGQGVGVQLAGLGLGGQPQRPAPGQFGHQPLVLRFTLIAPAAPRPGQHRAVRRQRGRQVAPCGHTSTVGQRFPRSACRGGLYRSHSARRAGRAVRHVKAGSLPWPLARPGFPHSRGAQPQLDDGALRRLPDVGAAG